MSTAQMPLQVFPVPDIGTVLARFLGPLNLMIVHKQKKLRWPCPGVQRCEDHAAHAMLKGYVAAQIWDQLKPKWVPVAFELTACAVELTGTTDLRGTSWVFWREPTQWGGKMVVGEQQARYDLSLLPREFDVRRTVERVWKRPIDWDVSAHLFAREFAEVSTDPPPVLPRKTQEPAKPLLAPEEVAAGVNRLKQRLGNGHLKA